MSINLHDLSRINLLKNSVWAAYEAWTDTMENRHHNAFGYDVVGFFDGDKEDQANLWVDQGGIVEHSECWAVPKEGASRRKLVMIPRINMEHEQPLPGTREREGG